MHTNVHGFSLCRYLPFDEWMLGVGPDAASSLATPVGTAAFLSMATAVAAPEGPLPLGEQPCELLVTSVSPGSPYDPTNAKRAGEPYTVTFSLLVRRSSPPTFARLLLTRTRALLLRSGLSAEPDAACLRVQILTRPAPLLPPDDGGRDSSGRGTFPRRVHRGDREPALD